MKNDHISPPAMLENRDMGLLASGAEAPERTSGLPLHIHVRLAGSRISVPIPYELLAGVLRSESMRTEAA